MNIIKIFAYDNIWCEILNCYEWLKHYGFAMCFSCTKTIQLNLMFIKFLYLPAETFVIQHINRAYGQYKFYALFCSPDY